jgi:hypothetical protein
MAEPTPKPQPPVNQTPETAPQKPLPPENVIRYEQDGIRYSAPPIPATPPPPQPDKPG